MATQDIIKQKYSAVDSVNYYLESVDNGISYFEKQVFDKYLKKNNKCLLLGCGAGREILPLAKSGYNLVGLDLVEELIFLAKKRLGEEGVRLRLIVGDMRNLMFKANIFDAVIISTTVIQHLSKEQRIKVLAEIKKILSKQGLIIMLVDNNNYYFSMPYSFWPLLDIVLKAREKIRNIKKGVAVQVKQASKVILRPRIQLYVLMFLCVFTIYLPSFFIDLKRTFAKKLLGDFYNGPEPGERFIRASFPLKSLSGLPIIFYRFKEAKRDIKESKLELMDYLSGWEIEKRLCLPYFLKIRSPRIAYIMKNS